MLLIMLTSHLSSSSHFALHCTALTHYETQKYFCVGREDGGVIISTFFACSHSSAGLNSNPMMKVNLKE
jgi:hypothetical protein